MVCAVVFAFTAHLRDISAQQFPPTPNKIMFDDPVRYNGYVADSADPKKLGTIDIGFFSPNAPEHSKGHSLWRGALLAVERANERGGYEGVPFRLVQRWQEDPWRAGTGEILRMIYDDRVWAVVGGIDGGTTHLVEQIATKARVPLVSPIASDPTLNYIRIPWMFRLAPGDDAQAELLASEIVDGKEETRVVLVNSTHHDDRIGSGEMLHALNARSRPAAAHYEFESPLQEPQIIAERIAAARPGALILWCGTSDAERIVRQLLDWEADWPIYGPFSLDTEEFREFARVWKNDVSLVSIWNESREAYSGRHFEGNYRKQFEAEPDYCAAYAFDAVTMIVNAVCEAGLNRARIRDAIADIPLKDPVTGSIAWDNGGGNAGAAGRISLELVIARDRADLRNPR